MKKLTTLLLLATTGLIVPLPASAADKSKTPDSPIYVLTDNDNTMNNSATFYVAGGSQGAPTLTFQQNVYTLRTGIGGGFFGTPRIAIPAGASSPCAYISNANTGDIAAINIQTQQLVGNFAASSNDVGTSNGIGIAVNQNYLYAGYTLSNTIATFAVGAGCQLSFLGDITVAPLNGGWVAGMALNGNILVVTYIDGSIQSFNTADGIPISNNDEQNASGFASAFFPDGVDITQDGHFAIFADAAVPTTVEVSDLSSGKLAPTVQYLVSNPTNVIGPGVNSATVRLSPDESLLYIGNSQSGTITAAFFNKNTGAVSPGCSSQQLKNFYDPWTYIGALVTRDTTDTGNVLYAAEFGSSIAIVNVTSTGTTCTLTEAASSPVTDEASPGLLSIQVYPPRPF
jgi:6-phosphogluconolactonase (cycloisomerase 2 family)